MFRYLHRKQIILEVCRLTEDEYWELNEEFEDDDSEFGDTFLYDEATDDDINMVIIPKFDYDIEEVLMGYVKSLKGCKTTEEAMEVLYDLYGQIRLITIIESEQAELQNRAQMLEMMMEYVEIR